jgi:hypothetical protein
MKKKKALLELLPRAPEASETPRERNEPAYPSPVFAHPLPRSPRPVEVVEPEVVVVLPTVFECVLVPGPDEIQ